MLCLSRRNSGTQAIGIRFAIRHLFEYDVLPQEKVANWSNQLRSNSLNRRAGIRSHETGLARVIDCSLDFLGGCLPMSLLFSYNSSNIDYRFVSTVLGVSVVLSEYDQIWMHNLIRLASPHPRIGM
jgi:hypothetical protein